MEKADVTKCVETTYGFRWGLTEVVREISHEKGIQLAIKTPRQTLRIWVTPTGLIRALNPMKNEDH